MQEVGQERGKVSAEIVAVEHAGPGVDRTAHDHDRRADGEAVEQLDGCSGEPRPGHDRDGGGSERVEVVGEDAGLHGTQATSAPLPGVAEQGAGRIPGEDQHGQVVLGGGGDQAVEVLVGVEVAAVDDVRFVKGEHLPSAGGIGSDGGQAGGHAQGPGSAPASGEVGAAGGQGEGAVGGPHAGPVEDPAERGTTRHAVRGQLLGERGVQVVHNRRSTPHPGDRSRKERGLGVVGVHEIEALPEVAAQGAEQGQGQGGARGVGTALQAAGTREVGEAPDVDAIGIGTGPARPAAEHDGVAPRGLGREQLAQVGLSALVGREGPGVDVQQAHGLQADASGDA